MLLCVCQRRAFPAYPLRNVSCRPPFGPNTSRIMSSSSPPSVPNGTTKPRYIDIGINLTDPVYRGKYHGTQRHPDDLDDVLSRAREAGCQKLIITGSDLRESEKAVQLAKQHPGYLYATVGIHPCSSQTFTKHPSGPAFVLSALRALATQQQQQQQHNDITASDLPSNSNSTAAPSSSPIVAFGEIGLDYDRLMLCPKDIQLTYFAAQLDLAISLGSSSPSSSPLPLFLHSRAAHTDFVRLLHARLPHLPRRGVVHSFTGSLPEMQELVSLGFDIGINGCSLKTAENVDVVRAVPIERLQLETDGPWCEMRASHAGAQFWTDADGAEAQEEKWKSVKKEKWLKGAMVKGRNEPCTIPRVALAVARIRGVSVEELTERAWENGVRMFGLV